MSRHHLILTEKKMEVITSRLCPTHIGINGTKLWVKMKICILQFQASEYMQQVSLFKTGVLSGIILLTTGFTALFTAWVWKLEQTRIIKSMSRIIRMNTKSYRHSLETLHPLKKFLDWFYFLLSVVSTYIRLLI